MYHIAFLPFTKPIDCLLTYHSLSECCIDLLMVIRLMSMTSLTHSVLRFDAGMQVPVPSERLAY